MQSNGFVHKDIFHKKGRIAMFDMDTYDKYKDRQGKVKRTFKFMDEDEDEY